ncbi:MAG: fructose-6-phosphate aldolase [Lawsonibacter sp.]
MEFLFDTADITLIEQYRGMFDYTGVTTNPALIRKAGVVEHTFAHFRRLRELIGFDRTLHMQVVSHQADEMVREAMAMLDRVDDQVCIKVPVTPEGMKAMKVLRDRGVRITATAVVTQMQALLALALDVDFIAPYYDQMCDIGIDGERTIRMLVDTIEKENKKTKILAANIKNMDQLRRVCMAGAQAITLNPQLLEESLHMPQIGKAVKLFDDAWQELHGEAGLCELAD